MSAQPKPFGSVAWERIEAEEHEQEIRDHERLEMLRGVEAERDPASIRGKYYQQTGAGQWWSEASALWHQRQLKRGRVCRKSKSPGTRVRHTPE